MDEQRILELIEGVVRPLRDKIERLERENEQLRTQMGNLLNNGHETPRAMRSKSRQERSRRPEEAKEGRPPSVEKKGSRPVWNYGKSPRGQNANFKSPPPADKNKYQQVTAKVTTRFNSKEKARPETKDEVKFLSFERPGPEVKKINGGQKVSEHGSPPQKGSEGPNSSQHRGTANPEHLTSQGASQHERSHLMTESVEQQQP